MNRPREVARQFPKRGTSADFFVIRMDIQRSRSLDRPPATPVLNIVLVYELLGVSTVMRRFHRYSSRSAPVEVAAALLMVRELHDANAHPSIFWPATTKSDEQVPFLDVSVDQSLRVRGYPQL